MAGGGNSLLVAVEQALAAVVDPCSIATGVPISLPEMGLVEDIRLDGGEVEVVLRLTSPVCWQVTNIVGEVTRCVEALPEVTRCRCVVDPGWSWQPEMMSEAARARLRAVRPLEPPTRRRRETAL